MAPSRPRVLLSPDKPGWCFDRIARQLHRLLSDEFEIDVRLAGDEAGARYDVAVALWWRTARNLRRSATIGRLVLSVFDHSSWPPSPVQPGGRQFLMAHRECDVVAVGNQQLAAEMPHGRPVFVVEDGVDCSVFTPQPLPEVFTVGWAGDTASGAGDPKGVAIIRRASELAGVPLVLADRRSNPVPHEAMPAWYGGISAYCCASDAEGTPNPVLEALACGRPVVSTDVGVVGRVVTPACGRIVARTPEAIAAALGELRAADLAAMGAAARAAAETFDWPVKAEAWRTCIRAALAGEMRATG